MKAKLRRAIHCLLSAAPLAAGAAPAPPPPPGAAGPAPVTYRDGGQARQAWRLGPAGDRARIRVRVGDGRQFDAEIDRHALARLAPGADPATTFAAHGLSPVRRVHRQEGIWQVVGRPGEDGLDVAARLAAGGPGLASVHPDLWLERQRHSLSIPPDDPRYPGQWYLDRIAIEEAWALSAGDRAVHLVVIDSGCAFDHPDLVDQFEPGAPGYDAVDDDADPRPQVGFPGDNHGTAVAGVAAARTDNGVGVAGACPLCRLSCVRLLPEDGGPVPLSADVAAFDYALEQGAWVVNNSWGFSQAMPAPADLARAIGRVVRDGRGGLGALVVFAVGNDSRLLREDELPALPGVLGVGATNLRNELTQFSNRGRAVDVVAPTGTLTTDLPGAAGEDPGDYTSLFGGTSSAAPLVAGVAGLLFAAAPDRRAEAIHEALVETALQSLFAAELGEDGHDPEYGFGVIRPARALRAVLGLPLDGPPDAGPTDAGPADAGPTDAGLTDAGPTDAGPTDAGLRDRGGRDGGGAEAGPENTKPAATDGGCEASAGPGGWWGLLVFPGLWLRSRRRRPRG